MLAFDGAPQHSAHSTLTLQQEFSSMSPFNGSIPRTTTIIVLFSLVAFIHNVRSLSGSIQGDSNILRQQPFARSGQGHGLRPENKVVKTSGPLDLEVLQRGKLYAVNVDDEARSFQLLHVDLASLRPQHLMAGPKGLSAQLRAMYPDANVGFVWYADTYLEDGWYRLEVRIDEDAPFPDVVKARAAGFVEGNLQGQHMYRYWTNYRSNEYRGRGEAPSQELYDFLDEQYGWMTKKVQAATGWDLATLRGASARGGSAASTSSSTTGAGSVTFSDRAGGGSGGEDEDEDEGGHGDVRRGSGVDRRYWSLVGLVAAQFEGLAAGFWASVVDPAQNMTWHELYTLNALGDLYELNVLFPPQAPAPTLPPTEGVEVEDRPPVRQRRYSPGHGEVGPYGYGELLDCSAIIKIDTAAATEEEWEEEEEEGDVAERGAGRVSAAADVAVPRRRLHSAADVVDAYSAALGRRGQQQWRQRGEPYRGLGAAAATGLAEEGGEAPQRPPRRHRVRNFWASHNTWRSYFEMVRTWKVYDLPWAASGPLTVSSSPGLLHSKDDWYTTDKFVVMETTNGIYNKELYDRIQPKCVLMWQRVQVANFGAREGSEWVDMFGLHNSGTYNNQWMVLDVPRLAAGRRTDVLWVLEQLPGTLYSRDVTRVLLDQGYWASYNVPYFPEVYNLTGYPQPSIYTTCPRARIFSREQSRLASLTDVMALMRLNRYSEDQLSAGLPNAAIAARYDLPAAPDPAGQPQNWTRRAYGAVDAKVVDMESFRQRRTYVINGPTADNQPPFSWSADPLFADVRHEGSVDTFTFGWQAYQSVMGPPLQSSTE